MPCSTAVALFIFNRPEQTSRVLRAIAQVQPSRLLVVADGPRDGRVGEDLLCQQTRALIESVNWPCSVQTNYSDINLGCRKRLSTGIDWVFGEVSEAILLEDDCLPHPTFFRFCEEMLERYRGDPRINMIRGSNFHFGKRFTCDSYYFSRFYNTWGWATWARAWEHYDVDMRQWPSLRDSGWLELQLPEASMAKVVRHLFDETHAGRYSTWDYQWALAGWLNGQLAVVPAVNLVTNIGFGASATTTTNTGSNMSNVPISPMGFPLSHPEKVELLQNADIHEWNMIYRTGWGWSNPYSYISQFFRGLRKSFRYLPFVRMK